MNRLFLPLIALVLALAGGCAQNPYLSAETQFTGHLSDETARLHGSAGPLHLSEARLITGNDAAFRSKLQMVEQAQDTIDAAYYIFSDDYSSSVLAKALIDAAKRGVRVRLLVDYFTNYKNLDLFTYMQRAGSSGKGSLEVRFYGRPSREIVMDAVYLTMGCGESQDRFPEDSCSQAKVDEVSRFFEAERIGDQPAAELDISNLDSGFSGLFLSGLYAKRSDLMAFAVLNGQSIDPAALQKSEAGKLTPADKERLKKLGRLYFDARVGAPARRLTARLELGVVSALFGGEVDPLHETLVRYLPVERQGSEAALRDWEHLTDYTHHKLLFVDGRSLQMGGRNVEDSYHMRANPLLAKYRFMDTDLRAEVEGDATGIGRAFDALWVFKPMVATTGEVLLHAPNDIAANDQAFDEAQKRCAERPAEEQLPCTKSEFDALAQTRAEREAARAATMESNAEAYWADYPYAKTPDPDPIFPVDPDAFAIYLENLPFHGEPGTVATRRSYGSVNGQEALYGKRIHGVWLAGLQNACVASAESGTPTRVILHHAYFFPPSNLLQAFAKMVNGEWDCRNVRLTVLTNSIQTTDLNVVNLFARHAAKAFAEYYLEHHDPVRSAKFEYMEYRPFRPDARLSLHTKVTVLGDDLVVGSANADVRSLMMDTNNAMLLRNAPELLAAYERYVDDLLGDPQKVADSTHEFVETPRKFILEDDMKSFQATMDKYRAERWLDSYQQERAKATLRVRLDEAYDTARAILNGPHSDKEAETFNRLFKPL